tara:strand:+ start:2530 stop:2760 length:231 start_codon:yes stop_codon:yes gene_type:complete
VDKKMNQTLKISQMTSSWKPMAAVWEMAKARTTSATRSSTKNSSKDSRTTKVNPNNKKSHRIKTKTINQKKIMTLK